MRARLQSLILLAVVALIIPATYACTHRAPTVVASVADVAARLQASGNVILHAADTASKTPNPTKQGVMLLTTRQVDLVAVDVFKLGKAGQRLSSGLKDYNTVKAAGKDTTALRTAIQQAVGDATDALRDVGVQVPSGTVSAIDQAVADALGVIAAIKVGGL